MAKSDVERDFPALIDKDYDHALGDLHNWWEPPSGHGQYWPLGFAEDTTVQTVEEIIKVHGFTVELSEEIAPETESIAIFAIGNEWTHFAKFSAGTWASKLGEGHDVSRVSLNDLRIDMYGKVFKILSRPKQ